MAWGLSLVGSGSAAFGCSHVAAPVRVVGDVCLALLAYGMSVGGWRWWIEVPHDLMAIS